MRKILLALTLILTVTTGSAASGELDDLIVQAESQKLSARKRDTTSGRRILREKVDRLREIDRQLPALMRDHDYTQAESLAKESLRLTIELYDSVNNVHVAERFLLLGVIYMRAGNNAMAEQALERARAIGESILGRGDHRLANIYSALAAVYYERGDFDRALNNADIFLAITLDRFGPDSPEAERAKNILKLIHGKRSEKR